MSAGPRLAPVPPLEHGPGGDGFGPDSLGRRTPAISIPAAIALQVARLTVATVAPSLLPAEKLEAMLRELADALIRARQSRDSGEAAAIIRWNRGAFASARWKGDDLL